MSGPVPVRAATIVPAVVFVLWVAAGVAIFVAPRHFHELTPGVSLFGPYNAHFVRDVGLVYLASGAVGLWGLRCGSLSLCRAATLWSALHAVFHVHVWIERGQPFDAIFLFDLCAVIAPPFVVLALCGRRIDAPAATQDGPRG
jgi:hypothetical protein